MFDNVKSGWKSVAVFACLTLSFLYLLYTSWFRWGSLVIDTFRDMLVCVEILHGRTLYRDIYCEYGPFPSYFMSLACRLFGVNIATFAGIGLCTSAVATFFIYRTSRLFAGRLESFITALVFLVVFAFGCYQHSGIFNFVIPYSFASIFLMCCTVTALYFFVRFVLLGRLWFLVAWFLVETISFLCRVDMSLLVWGGFVVVGVFLVVKPPEGRKLLRGSWFVLLLVAPVVTAVLAYGTMFLAVGGFSEFRKSCLQLAFRLSAKMIASWCSGTVGTTLDVLVIGKSALVHAVGILLLVLGVAAVSRPAGAAKGAWVRKAVGVGTVMGSFYVFYKFLPGGSQDLQYRSMPGVLLAGLVICAVGLVRNENRRLTIAMLAVYLVSILMMGRVILVPTVVSYSYCLVPGIIGYYLFFLKIIPEIAGRISRQFSASLYLSLVTCLFVLLTGRYWGESSARYAQRNMQVLSDVGQIYCYRDSEACNTVEAVRFLLGNTDKNATVLAVPECVGVNFLAQRRNPLKYQTFIPPIIDSIGEEKIVEEFTEAKIDYVVFVSRTTFEYGRPFFGVDYGTKIYQRILRDYQLVKQIGPYPFTSQEFGIAIFKSK